MSGSFRLTKKFVAGPVMACCGDVMLAAEDLVEASADLIKEGFLVPAGPV